MATTERGKRTRHGERRREKDWGGKKTHDIHVLKIVHVHVRAKEVATERAAGIEHPVEWMRATVPEK